LKNKKLLFLVAGLTIIFSTFLCLYSGRILDAVHKTVKVFKPSIVRFEAFLDDNGQFDYDSDNRFDLDSGVQPSPPNADYFPNNG